MMRILLFVLLFQGSLFAQNMKYNRAYFNNFPDIDLIAESYFAAFPEHINYGSALNFEKKYDGWYLSCKNWKEPEKNLFRTKIWDANQKKYLLSISTTVNAEMLEIIKQTAQSFKVWEYFVSPLFGYEGYEQDIINMMEAVPLSKMNAPEMESLSRAYALIAVNTIGWTFPYITYTAYDSTLENSPQWTEKIKNSDFLPYAKKSLDILDEINKRYAHWSTIVGSYPIKKANDCMSYYLHLMTCQQVELAKTFLDLANYKADVLEIAKNYLMACPPNAILFTHGDNDIYPLIYVQQKLGYRSDVTIMDHSLNSVARFINYQVHKISDSLQVKTLLDVKQQYSLNKNEYLIIEQDEENTGNIKEFLRQLNDNPSQFANNPNYPNTAVIPFKKMRMGSNRKFIEVTIARDFIYKNELFFIDVLCNNWDKRPICFTSLEGLDPYFFEDLSHFIEVNGIIGILTDERNEQSFPINQAASEKILLEDFYYASSKTKKENTFEYSVYQGYMLSIMSKILAQQIKTGLTEEALLQKIDLIYKKVPLENFAYWDMHLAYLSLYFSLSPQHPNIDKHLNNIALELKTIKKDLKKYKDLPLYKYFGQDKVYTNFKNSVIEFLKTNNRRDLLKKIEKI